MSAYDFTAAVHNTAQENLGARFLKLRKLFVIFFPKFVVRFS